MVESYIYIHMNGDQIQAPPRKGSDLSTGVWRLVCKQCDTCLLSRCHRWRPRWQQRGLLRQGRSLPVISCQYGGAALRAVLKPLWIPCPSVVFVSRSKGRPETMSLRVLPFGCRPQKSSPCLYPRPGWFHRISASAPLSRHCDRHLVAKRLRSSSTLAKA